MQVIGDEKSLVRSFNRSSKAASSFGKDLDRTSRGALSATLRVTGLSRALTFASAQFLGGAGLAFAFTSTIKAAEQSQVVIGQTSKAVQNAGLSWAQYGKQVEKAALAQSQLSGFDDEALLRTFSLFVRNTRDVNKALRENAIAIDVARGRNISLEAAAQLVNKAALGQAGALRRVGIAAKVGASSTELLTLLQEKFAGSAERFGNTAAGAQARFRVALENTQEALGKNLLPTINTYLNRAADWLNSTDNQEKLQQKLAQALHAGASVLRALGEGFKVALQVARPLVDAVGGLRNALLGLVALRLASRVTGWVQGFAALATQAVGTSGKVTALRASLVRLGALGAITIGVEVLLNKDRIDKSITGFLRSHHLGVFTGAQIQIPVNASIGDVERIREQVRTLRGDTSLYTQTLDKLIKKMKEQGATATAVLSREASDFQQFLKETSGVPPVPTFEQALQASGFRNSTGKVTRQIKLTAEQRNKFFDALIGRKQDRVQDISSLQGQLAALQQISGLLSERLARTKDVTRRLTLEDDLLVNERAQKSVRQQLAQEFSASLQLGLDRAQATAGFKDDLKALQRINADIQAQIREVGHTADLDSQLFQNQQAITAARLEQRNRLQFRTLGLGPTGEALVPFKSTLARQLKQVAALIPNTFLDTAKTNKTLEAIRKLVLDPFTKVSASVREVIKGILDDLNKQLKDHKLPKRGPLDTQKLLSQIGFPADAVRLAQAGLQPFAFPSFTGPSFAGAGGGTFVVEHQTVLDGRVLERSTTKYQQKRRTRNPLQRRG